MKMLNYKATETDGMNKATYALLRSWMSIGEHGVKNGSFYISPEGDSGIAVPLGNTRQGRELPARPR